MYINEKIMLSQGFCNKTLSLERRLFPSFSCVPKKTNQKTKEFCEIYKYWD